MDRAEHHEPASRDDNPRQGLRRGVRLGRVAGVELVADWSLLLIFALIVVNLGAGVFPVWHPEWSTGLAWALAGAAAVLFFLSVALHELSHAVVGRAAGIPINRITLFVFGGMAHMEREPQSAKAEFLMAVVGPITSIGLGILALLAGALLTPVEELGADPEALLRSLGPLATLLLWLGPINLVLGVFNMIPGFPLDGGRVLRAAIWGATGDFEKATRWAARMGQAFAWILMATGVLMVFGFWFPILGGGVVQGMWLLLIGWFLSNAARTSLRQMLVRRALEDVSVRDIMRSVDVTVPPTITIRQFVDDYIMHSDQASFPVVELDELLGTIQMEDITRTPREAWNELTVRQVMAPVEDAPPVSPDDDAMSALRRLNNRDVLPVVERGRLTGLARRQDLLKWVTLGERASAERHPR